MIQIALAVVVALGIMAVAEGLVRVTDWLVERDRRRDQAGSDL
jgi:hypothetical protein